MVVNMERPMAIGQAVSSLRAAGTARSDIPAREAVDLKGTTRLR